MNIEVCDVKDVVNHEKESQKVCKWNVLKFNICLEDDPNIHFLLRVFKVTLGCILVFKNTKLVTQEQSKYCAEVLNWSDLNLCVSFNESSQHSLRLRALINGVVLQELSDSFGICMLITCPWQLQPGTLHWNFSLVSQIQNSCLDIYLFSSSLGSICAIWAGRRFVSDNHVYICL